MCNLGIIKDMGLLKTRFKISVQADKDKKKRLEKNVWETLSFFLANK